ncbi:MATE family efflux transporter [Croceicoccus sp. F390]|uniref:Multidrug-efflux transporter n=1 Tax=Croceicoccus esteveae TaxID=3075597 RepID=A0ABU2ZGU1_9SPHN|nr:MATE family efflux transporter [Croceicoccus sp. F390]MDT0575813.1 MATE family efflux transporter [Croceicoccus sp. F390]
MRAFLSSPLRAELRETTRLATPLAAANLLQMMVYAIDVIFVAPLGTEELAAITLSTSIYGLSLWCAMGLVGAVAPLAASALGRGRHAVREVRRSIRMGLWVSALAGLAIMVLALAGEPIMRATGQPPLVSQLAGDYLTIVSFAAIPVVASSALRIFVSTLGRAVIATWVTVFALGINALGNWLLIYGHWGLPALGLKGAALASVLTSLATIGAYAAIIQSDRRLRRYHVFGRLWRADPARLLEIWRIGLPIAAIILAEAGLFSIAAFLMGALGKLELAAHTVALQIASLAFQVPFGIAQAATIRVGLHHGRGNADAIRLAGISAMLLAIGFAVVFVVTMLAVPQWLLSIYLDVDDPRNATLLVLAGSYMTIAAAFQLFDGVQAVAAGLLRGLADTRVPFVLAVIGYWPFGFGSAWLLAFHTPLGGLGVWMGLAVGLIVTAAMMLWRWQRRGTLGLLDRSF